MARPWRRNRKEPPSVDEMLDMEPADPERIRRAAYQREARELWLLQDALREGQRSLEHNQTKENR